MATTTPVMLATPGGEPSQQTLAKLTASGRWVFDLKHDGVRALWRINDGGSLTRLINRRGVDISHRYPELIEAARRFAGRQLVLDGELVCVVDGTPDFAAIHRRDAQANQFSIRRLAQVLPATFMAFDLLELDGLDLRGLPLGQRLEELEDAVQDESRVRRSITSLDGPLLWRQVVTHDLEGLVAKRLDSRYVAGRSSSWRKFKRTRRLSAAVAGCTQGTGSRASSFGALRLVLFDGDRPVDIGEVGSGFSQVLLAECRRRLDAGEPFVVEVEYGEVSPDGKLRFPVCKGIRTDVVPADCTISQLGGK